MNELCFILAPYRGFRPVRDPAATRRAAARFGRPAPVAPATPQALAKAS